MIPPTIGREDCQDTCKTAEILLAKIGGSAIKKFEKLGHSEAER